LLKDPIWRFKICAVIIPRCIK